MFPHAGDRMDHPLQMVVGLGNPGRHYAHTRHNVGFQVLDRLAALAGVSFQSRPRWQAQVAKLPAGTVLLKPQTFMNLSGQAVRAAAAYHKWPPASLLVVFDDVALPLGTLRFREAGSHGGHNGIRSLIEQLGTSAFPRLKIGIGGGGTGELTGHVLGRFRPEERELVENALATAVEAVQLALSQGIAPAANRFNTRRKTATPETDEQEI
jgi:PTH1 family peptidyl-tRNA hydrolase